MKITIGQLRKIRGDLRSESTVTNEILIELIDIELRRRARSGRPKIDKELLERNREAARKYRKSKKMNAVLKDRLELRKAERYDTQMQKAGLRPKRRKKGTRNRQHWQSVPQVRAGGLHY
jgi:hypothetical protein